MNTRVLSHLNCAVLFAGLFLSTLPVADAGNEPPIPTDWTFQKKVSAPAYEGNAKFPYYPSVLTKANGQLMDARRISPRIKQPGLLAVSEDHGGSKHSGIRLYTFSPANPGKLTHLTTVKSPINGNHMETPWLFIRPSDQSLCMTAHVSSQGGGQETILMCTKDGVNWRHEGTAIPIPENGGHTGYARGYVHDGMMTYVSLHQGGSNPTWFITQDRDGDGLNAEQVGDPMEYFQQSNGRGTEPAVQQIIHRNDQWWGLFLRKKIGSSGNSIGNSTLLLQRYDKSRASDYSDLFRHVTKPRHVLVKPGDNRFVKDGVTSAWAYRFRNQWFMYVAGREDGGTNHLLLYTGSRP